MSLQSKVQDLIDLFPLENGDVGFFTCAVYDTAWVSMVAKPTRNGKIWLLPECFRYIIDSQLPDGGWPSYAADVDGILNTAASLLALKAHQANAYQITEYLPEELSQRLSSAAESLRIKLQAWDVDKTVHVGFEILVPAILALLEEQGLIFDFAGRENLMKLNQLKMSQFKLAYLYSSVKTTALHSLEAFAGKLDYDKLRHHKTFGAYMASPSSTAACLMYSSSWDDESEEYLKWTVAAGAGQGNGGVPSAFPSTFFDITWVLTTLLEGGFTVDDIGEARAGQFALFLRKSLDEQNGRMGFARSVGVDADDTAKTLLALSLLGQPAPHQGLLDEFEGETHFHTYKGERNPSFSANCNVLVALLSQPNVSTLTPQVIKVASFLSREWWESKGAIEDKWNLSEFYPSMLMAEAFSSLLQVWEQGELFAIPTSLVVDGVIISLFQVLVRTLMTQNTNGSWGPSNSREVTAYATLTISKASTLPFPAVICAQVDSAIASAQEFLLRTKETAPSFLWVEKVTYGSIVLGESYVLAALNASPKVPLSLSSRVASLAKIPSVDVEHLTKVCFGSLLFDSTEAWKLQAAFLEGCLHRPYLQRLADDVVPGAKNDKVFEVVPFVWTMCNYSAKQSLTTSSLRRVIGASLLEQLGNKPFKGNTSTSNGTAHSIDGSRLVNGESMHEGLHTAVNGHSEHEQGIKRANGDFLKEELTTTVNGDSKPEEPSMTKISARANQACTRVLRGAASTYHTAMRVPDELTFLLPANFTGNLTDTFFEGTTTSDASVNALLTAAARSTFTSYDDDFARIVGPKVSTQLVANRPGSGAFFEAGVYIPSLDEVWFTSSYARYPKPGYITAYNKRTYQSRNISDVPYGAGGYYFSGKVYVGGLTPGAGVTVTDPTTLHTSTIFNSYFGLPITLVDDLVWVRQSSSNASYLFFTSFFTALEPGASTPRLDRPVALPNGVWRWDPQERVLLPVISRLDIPIPNGIRISPDQKTLYVTDSLSTHAGGIAEGNQGYAPTAGPNIYAYDLNNAGLPVNKRVFGLVRTGYADGIHVDDTGRVWTAEGEGIVVRSAKGKVLGVFNAAAFGIDTSSGVQIANFALAGDTLFVGAFDSLYAVELAEVVAIGQS